MPYEELADFLAHVGKDPSRLIFEDELTGIHNRRFLRSYLEHKVRWVTGQDYPLSMLVIDMDQFKEINDTHGHQTGDQVLTWMASLIKEIGGQNGLPIRYGGDEYVLLLPGGDRDEARESANRLLERTRDHPFGLRGSGVTLYVTLSVGVATAPDDAINPKELFQAADTALYYAKQSGRNQAADAAGIDLQKVFPKTALHRLEATGIAGRNEELAAVSESLEKLSRGHSQLLIFEGGPGMGKTTFLENVRSNLADEGTFFVTKVAGDQQAAYQPYNLATRILVAVLSAREDKGEAALQDLTSEQVAHLSRVLPQLSEGGVASEDERDEINRQAIFATLAQFLPRAVDFRPLVLLIDDLQYADEATLLLLRVLIQRQEMSLLVCGSSLESLKLGGEQEASPLERFYSSHHKDLEIRRLKLRPLDDDDIAEYLRGVFPSLRTPRSFETHLAHITQGNPLFLGEIIRKLVMDQKVNLVGQEWVIESLEEGYLPRSLEEIVSEKIAALDEEDRRLLERASTLGEDIPVSVLAGSSDLDENKVLEFLDRAEALGLISLDFQVNDEVMHFLGKQVLEISYGTIDEDGRARLHEQVGDYQEGLYEQHLLTSASLLAYHFKRSANEEKARRYEHVQLAHSQEVFNPDEVAHYTEELLDEEETEERLVPESIPLVPRVLRTFMTTVRSIQLYPPESETIGRSMHQVTKFLEEILAKNDHLHFAHAQRSFLVNGQRLDVSSFGAVARAFLELLAHSELQGIVFNPGISDGEIRVLVTTLSNLKPDTIDRGFWKNFVEENGLKHIELQQVRYSHVRRRKAHIASRALTGEEEELAADELGEIPKILRALQGAAKNSVLYPIESEPVSRSVEALYASLQGVLSRRQTLTLAGADKTLLVNGKRVDTGGYETLAASLIEFIGSVGLSSITFFSTVQLAELKAFVGALREISTSGADGAFWDDFARDNGLAGLAFNQRQYAFGMLERLLSTMEADVDNDTDEVDATARLAEQLSEKPSEALLEALPRFGRELLVKAEHQLMRRLLRRLFQNFENRDPLSREETVQACHMLLDSLILGLRSKFTELAADPLLSALSEETEPRVLQELAAVLYTMASSALQFADHQMAGRILMEVKRRRQQLREAGDKESLSLAKILDRRLDPTAQKLLADDLTSGQSPRLERAAQVLGGLGRSAIPLLIQVVKQEKDFRVRQIAASLLYEKGPEAHREIKRALVTEVVVEQRFHILEVIDTVTRDLRQELAYCLGDDNQKIRRAAFRLFERLHDDSMIDMVVPIARGKDRAAAKGAIRSIAHLRSTTAIETLVSILDSAEHPEVAIACCQGLGQQGAGRGIDALARVLAQRKFPFLKRRWSEQVRATAAMALRQIADPEAAKVLSRYTTDRSPRIRELASSTARRQDRRGAVASVQADEAVPDEAIESTEPGEPGEPSEPDAS